MLTNILPKFSKTAFLGMLSLLPILLVKTALARPIGTVKNWNYLIAISEWTPLQTNALLRHASGKCEAKRAGKSLAARPGPLTHVTLDMYSVNPSLTKKLKAVGTQAICYTNFGGLEDWRSDFAQWNSRLKSSKLLGPCIKKLDGGCWPGEKWLAPPPEARSNPTLQAYVRTRLERAKTNGCEIVELDNLDGFLHEAKAKYQREFDEEWINRSSERRQWFSERKEAWISYSQLIADQCQSLGLSCGFKNAIEIAPRVADRFDFVTTERCRQFRRGDGSSECKGFQDIFPNKPILNIEYEERPSFPSTPNRMHLSRGDDEMKDLLPSLMKHCSPNPKRNSDGRLSSSVRYN